jgi:D-alanyl-D-alanine carboxypeptidase (penicillin-binding protein 5/6)
MFKPARRLVLAVALAAAAIGGAGVGAPGQAFAQPRFVTTESKYAAIVMDAATGEVLYQRNPDAQRYPASISKIMTLYLTFEALSTGRLKLTDRIVVSQHAANMAPSRLGLRPGESISVDDAMRAVAVKSANDMAVALAERIGGSESRFASLMTLRAQELGMTNTHYVNASGLPDVRQISSARDIATLSRAVMRDYPQYYSYFSIKRFDYHGQSIANHNGLLNKMQGVDGLKTGFINASGFNLAASAVRDNHRLIAVVLGGNTTAARDAHVEDLLDTGFVVLKRRALGQTVDFAQNLSEPAPIGLITRPPTEEGSADQAGVKIVLTNTDAAAHPAADSAAPNRGVAPEQPTHAAAVRPERAERPARLIQAKADKGDSAADRVQQGRRHGRARAGGEFTVQVGAYKGKAQAHAQVAAISRHYAHQLGDADGGVDSGGRGYYRARFAGLSASDAKDACRALRAHHETCMVVAER